MTVHNSLQHYNDLSRAYKNALGLDEGGLERAGETLTPTFPLFQLPEYALQRGELLGSVYAQQTAVAAQYGGVGVGCTAAQPYLITVELAQGMAVSGAPAIYTVRGHTIGQLTTLLATAVLVYGSDARRWNGAGAALNNPIPVTARQGTAAVPGGDILGAFWCNSAGPTAQTIETIGPLVVNPGHAIALWSDPANVTFMVTMRLRVRALRPGEDSA